MTKIKKSLVEQIIKEEVIKIKKLKTLQEEKKSILKQLNELYEENLSEEELDEWGNPFKTDPAAIAAKAQPLIDVLKSQTAKTFFTQMLQSNPGMVMSYLGIFKQRVAASQPKLAKLQEAMQVSFDRALAYMKAVAAAPVTANIQWDEAKGKYVDLTGVIGNSTGSVNGFAIPKMAPKTNPAQPTV